MKNVLGIAVFVAYTVLVAFVSLQPASGVSIGSYDKVAHFLTYAIFAGLAWAISWSSRAFVYACVAIAVYGALLEFGQSFVPGRDMSLLDLVANTVGVVLGAAICTRLLSPRK